VQDEYPQLSQQPSDKETPNHPSKEHAMTSEIEQPEQQQSSHANSDAGSVTRTQDKKLQKWLTLFDLQQFDDEVNPHWLHGEYNQEIPFSQNGYILISSLTATIAKSLMRNYMRHLPRISRNGRKQTGKVHKKHLSEHSERH
jgi:hypothetical protein